MSFKNNTYNIESTLLFLNVLRVFLNDIKGLQDSQHIYTFFRVKIFFLCKINLTKK